VGYAGQDRQNRTLAFPPAEWLWALKPDFHCGWEEKREFALFFFRARRFRFFFFALSHSYFAFALASAKARKKRRRSPLPFYVRVRGLCVHPTEYTECWPCPLFNILLNKYIFSCWLAWWQVGDPSALLVQSSRECTPPYLSTGISNLLQPAHAEVVLGQLSMYLASWVGPLPGVCPPPHPVPISIVQL
jgi:hypothetical protein